MCTGVVADSAAHDSDCLSSVVLDLTRIDLSLDIQPSNLIDKASRGMRFAKRAVRGDLHRFKAYAELGFTVFAISSEGALLDRSVRTALAATREAARAS